MNTGRRLSPFTTRTWMAHRRVCVVGCTGSSPRSAAFTVLSISSGWASNRPCLRSCEEEESNGEESFIL
jgi:hypothetical protein